MNESDPIVDEVRRIRDAHAARFNYDPDAIFRDIKEREKQSGRKYVSFADEKAAPQPAPRPATPPLPISRDIQSLPTAPAAEL